MMFFVKKYLCTFIISSVKLDCIICLKKRKNVLWRTWSTYGYFIQLRINGVSEDMLLCKIAQKRILWIFAKAIPMSNCCLLCLLSVSLKVTVANSVDPDQTAPLGAVWSGSTLFACMQKVCLKSLQEDAADDINRWHFQTQVFLAF